MDAGTSGPNICFEKVTCISSMSICIADAANGAKIVPEWSESPIGISNRSRYNGMLLMPISSGGQGYAVVVWKTNTGILNSFKKDNVC